MKYLKKFNESIDFGDKRLIKAKYPFDDDNLDTINKVERMKLDEYFGWINTELPGEADYDYEVYDDHVYIMINFYRERSRFGRRLYVYIQKHPDEYFTITMEDWGLASKICGEYVCDTVYGVGEFAEILQKEINKEIKKYIVKESIDLIFKKEVKEYIKKQSQIQESIDFGDKLLFEVDNLDSELEFTESKDRENFNKLEIQRLNEYFGWIKKLSSGFSMTDNSFFAEMSWDDGDITVGISKYEDEYFTASFSEDIHEEDFYEGTTTHHNSQRYICDTIDGVKEFSKVFNDYLKRRHGDIFRYIKESVNIDFGDEVIKEVDQEVAVEFFEEREVEAFTKYEISKLNDCFGWLNNIDKEDFEYSYDIFENDLIIDIGGEQMSVGIKKYEDEYFLATFNEAQWYETYYICDGMSGVVEFSKIFKEYTIKTYKDLPKYIKESKEESPKKGKI